MVPVIMNRRYSQMEGKKTNKPLLAENLVANPLRDFMDYTGMNII